MRGNMERLPKWAQDEIRLLDNRILHLEEQLKIARKEHGESNVSVVDWTHERPDFFLEEHSTIRFKVGKFDHEYIDCSAGDGGIQVRGYSRISVLPSASNSIDVKPTT